jgi:hypothetical protein
VYNNVTINIKKKKIKKREVEILSTVCSIIIIGYNTEEKLQQKNITLNSVC